MEIPFELIPLAGILVGGLVVLIPIMGFTARYVLKPFEETLARYLDGRVGDESVRLLERRMSLMEQQLETMESTLNRVADAADFHRELRSPAGAVPAALPTPQSAPVRTPPGDARP